MDAGLRALWKRQLLHDPLLEPLRGEAEFGEIVAELEVDMAAQLTHVREMKADSKLALIPD